MQPAARRDAIRLVVEALREHFREVPHGHRSKQLRMNAGYSVRAVRADDRKVRHSNLPLGRLLDQADALHTPFVARKPASDRVEQPAVDLENDLEMARQE